MSGWKTHQFSPRRLQHHVQAPLFHRSAHTHLLSHYSTVVGGEGRGIQSLVCGWFGDETNPHVSRLIAVLGSRNWWNEVCILHGAEAGNYDLELVSTARLKSAYGL